MVPATVDASSCGMSYSAPSSAREGASAEPSDDWLSCFDFSDLPPAPPILDFLELDCTGSLDISDLLRPEENSPSFDSSEENLPFFNFSEGFSSIIEPNEADRAAHQCELTFTFEVGSPFHNDSSTISSPHNSDAGSSVAVAEGVNFHKEGLDNTSPESYGHAMKNYSVASSRRKRQHEDTGSDIEGVDGEGKSELDPLDKKQQRLLRNRELAFESRQRKKCYVSDLEAKCKMLEQERNQLQQQICFSAAENAVLKEELSRIKKLKGREGVTEPAVLFEDSLPLEFLSLLICLLLMARLSLCVSPFLALVLRAVVCPQSPIKAEGLLKEQVDSKRCFHFIIEDIRWSLNHLWFHKPLRVCGLFMACG